VSPRFVCLFVCLVSRITVMNIREILGRSDNRQSIKFLAVI